MEKICTTKRGLNDVNLNYYIIICVWGREGAFVLAEMIKQNKIDLMFARKFSIENIEYVFEIKISMIVQKCSRNYSRYYRENMMFMIVS